MMEWIAGIITFVCMMGILYFAVLAWDKEADAREQVARKYSKQMAFVEGSK